MARAQSTRLAAAFSRAAQRSTSTAAAGILTVAALAVAGCGPAALSSLLDHQDGAVAGQNGPESEEPKLGGGAGHLGSSTHAAPEERGRRSSCAPAPARVPSDVAPRSPAAELAPRSPLLCQKLSPGGAVCGQAGEAQQMLAALINRERAAV